MENNENSRHFNHNIAGEPKQKVKEFVINANNANLHVATYNMVYLNDVSIGELLKEQLGEVKLRADVTIIIKERPVEVIVIKNDFKKKELIAAMSGIDMNVLDEQPSDTLFDVFDEEENNG